MSQPLVKKMARNYRRKCDEVDYGCDSGGEDYEYESEGEDIMDDDGDDLDEEDEDLADEEDEEEDGQEFFIPDTPIIERVWPRRRRRESRRHPKRRFR